MPKTPLDCELFLDDVAEMCRRNWINGNLSDAMKAIGELNPFAAACVVARVVPYLESKRDPASATMFLRRLKNEGISRMCEDAQK